MIRMMCDHCGQEIDSSINGGCRVRTGNKELSFHLCAKHQNELREIVKAFCVENVAREVNPSLSVKS